MNTEHAFFPTKVKQYKTHLEYGNVLAELEHSVGGVEVAEEALHIRQDVVVVRGDDDVGNIPEHNQYLGSE